MTGRFDYHVRVACRSADDLDHTVRAIRAQGVAAQSETRIILRSARGSGRSPEPVSPALTGVNQPMEL